MVLHHIYKKRVSVFGVSAKLYFGGNHGYALSKMFLLQQILFLCQLNFIEIMRLSQS